MNRNPLLQTIATPSEERRPTVFISYCREDRKEEDRLIADLKAAGYDCWIDTSSIKGGEDRAVRLPTEFEWEMAARGTVGRLYLYEGEFDPKNSNVGDTGFGQTSAVGIFPNSASTTGGEEMHVLSIVTTIIRRTDSTMSVFGE